MLGLASTIRPTSLAAVYALARERSPRRMMTAYVVVGLLFTIAFGVVVITSFNGVDLHVGSNHTKGIAEIAAGILAIGLGLGVLSGHVSVGGSGDEPVSRGGREGRRARNFTLGTAALAGPATHIPGLLYLVALDLIVATQRNLSAGILDVLVFNAIWFALPIAVLCICVFKPPAARLAAEAVQAWTRAHARTIALVVSFGLGGALVLAGVLAV